MKKNFKPIKIFLSLLLLLLCANLVPDESKNPTSFGIENESETFYPDLNVYQFGNNLNEKTAQNNLLTNGGVATPSVIYKEFEPGIVSVLIMVYPWKPGMGEPTLHLIKSTGEKSYFDNPDNESLQYHNEPGVVYWEFRRAPDGALWWRYYRYGGHIEEQFVYGQGMSGHPAGPVIPLGDYTLKVKYQSSIQGTNPVDVRQGFSTPGYSHYLTKTLNFDDEWEVMNFKVIKDCEILDVEYFSQCDEGWKESWYDSSDYIICQKGCAITSMAMIINYYAKQINRPDLETDPEKLNSWLSQNEGFKEYFSEEKQKWTADLYWDAIDRYSGKAIRLDQQMYYNPVDDNPVHMDNIMAKLNEKIENGEPVILRVPSNPHHFIVAKGKCNSTYQINDPGHKEAETLEYYNNELTGINTFTLGPGDASGVSIKGHSPIEMCLVDPNGQRIGYDPVIQAVVREIPRSNYGEEGIGDHMTGEPCDDVTKVIDVRIPVSGLYKLKIISTGIGKYNIAIRCCDSDGEPTDVEILGYTGVDHEVAIGYSSTPGAKIDVEKEVTFVVLNQELKTAYELSLIDNKGIFNALQKKLESAEAALSKSNKNAAKGILKAFINQLTAQKGKHIAESTVEILIKDAECLLNTL